MPAAPHRSLTCIALEGIPMVAAGDDIAAFTIDAVQQQGLEPRSGDVFCFAQKIVSKAEGRLIPLSSVAPSARAVELAAETDKDPRLVQLILDESDEVLRKRPGVLIVRHKLGLVGAHAGIDQSNIQHAADGECALLLPEDPDRSASMLRDRLRQAFGVELGVIVTDSSNRPWRLGTIGSAIGSAGITVLDDRCGERDSFGRELKVTLINRADAIATAATLVMGETTERTPVALVRGLPPEASDQTAGQTAGMAIRPLDEDLFR